MNPYQILGIQRSATEEDIKKAFRRLAHIHHPDKQGGSAEMFKRISEAKDLAIKNLSSPFVRYDPLRSRPNGGFWSPPSYERDVYADLMKKMNDAMNEQYDKRRKMAEDLMAQMQKARTDALRRQAEEVLRERFKRGF